MPTVQDFPFRPWSTGFSLGFGPLYFVPPVPPPIPPEPVTGASGGEIMIQGDKRSNISVRVL